MRHFSGPHRRTSCGFVILSQQGLPRSGVRFHSFNAKTASFPPVPEADEQRPWAYPSRVIVKFIAAGVTSVCSNAAQFSITLARYRSARP